METTAGRSGGCEIATAAIRVYDIQRYSDGYVGGEVAVLGKGLSTKKSYTGLC